MYGTLDTSHIWQIDYVTLICLDLEGFRRGKHSAALFRNSNEDVRMAVHADDFVCLSVNNKLKHIDKHLKPCTAKDVGTLGFEESDVKSLLLLNRSYNQSFLPSTHDSAESTVTPPPESDFDDEQLRALLASRLNLQERGASAERSQVYHSERESLMSCSSQDPKPVGTGKPVAVFSSQSRLNQDTFSDRGQPSLKHQQVLGVLNRFFRFSDPHMLRNLLLMESEITCLLKRDLN